MRQTYMGAVIAGGGDGFGIHFPDLPGLATGGDTLTELALMAHDGLQVHVEAMAEYGERVPEPAEFSLDDLARQWAVDGDALSGGEYWHSLMAVTVDVPEFATVPIAIDTDVVRAIDQAGQDRRSFIMDATRRELDRLKKTA